jgi:membrane associated rhomboid family serine protease
MYYLIRQFVADDNWASPMFRRRMRVMTLTWAIGLLIEAATRIVLVHTVSVNTAAALSPVLTGVALAVLMTWTAGYGRRAGEARRVAEA